MDEVTRRSRVALFSVTVLAMCAIVGTAVLALYTDRQQCRAAAQAIDNSRTMWIYLLEQNPGAEADQFRLELDRRIPPAHCDGGTLIVDRSPASTIPPG